METWRLGHRPALDGLRGIAVLLVLAAHLGVPYWNGGQTGVVVFFALSGFLITSLLLKERAETGAVCLRRFWERRARRLVPAMLACVALATCLQLVLRGRVSDWDLVVGSLTYTANFQMLDGEFYPGTGLGHMWSLAIEEQFYLTWPLIVLATAKVPRKMVLWVLVAACAAGTLLRLALWNGPDSWDRIYFGTDTRADAILAGCLLAFLLHGAANRRAGRDWLPVGLGLIVLTASMVTQIHQPTTAILLPTLMAFGAWCVIYAATQGRGRWLGWGPLTWFGSRSYGIYLYQAPVGVAAHATWGATAATSWLVIFPIVLAVAELSWRFVERPFRRRRSGDREVVEATIAHRAGSRQAV